MPGAPSSHCAPAPGVRCDAVPFPPFGRCLEHLAGAERDQALAALAPGAAIDVRGTRFTGKLLSLLQAALNDPAGEPVFGAAQFSGAWFEDAVSFGKARFTGDVSFAGAQFTGVASFAGASFSQDADFAGARFHDAALFRDLTVTGTATFTSARFDDTADFTAATFTGAAVLRQAVFTGAVVLDRVRGHASASFSEARFSAASHLGPVFVAGELSFDATRFEQKATITAGASAFSARGASFTGATTLRLGYADASLDNVTSTEPFTIIGASRELAVLGYHPAPALAAAPQSAPALLSLAGVDASQLVLVDVDLSECRFADAFNLDELRFEGSQSRFADPPRPRGWRWVLPSARRQMIAEERDWRATRRHLAWPPRRHPSPPLEPERILTIYRQLRKAQEDAKNEPGAADFYYGEMEMRRHAATTPAADKLILLLYWAASGYGLRAFRALGALAATLALSTVAFATFGFGPAQALRYLPVPAAHPAAAQAYQQVTIAGPRPGWLSALFYSLDSSTSLLSGSQPNLTLTSGGDMVQIALKLLGPVFVGLAILAMRNRIKR
jgi:uncharacterized protein YjbI with pentapeptide repeats